MNLNLVTYKLLHIHFSRSKSYRLKTENSYSSYSITALRNYELLLLNINNKFEYKKGNSNICPIRIQMILMVSFLICNYCTKKFWTGHEPHFSNISVSFRTDINLDKIWSLLSIWNLGNTKPFFISKPVEPFKWNLEW